MTAEGSNGSAGGGDAHTRAEAGADPAGGEGPEILADPGREGPETVADAAADALAAEEPILGRGRENLPRAIRELSTLDRAVYVAVARADTPTLDRGLAQLSRVADHSALWAGIGAGLAAAGGTRGRRAAGWGLGSIAVTSGLVNLVFKPFGRRRRPDRAGARVPSVRHVEMPTSLSFPSGHSASAFAFASAAGHHLPAAAVPLQFLAGLVAYSRVHTGVHYPGDVVVGSLIGAGAAGVVTAASAARAARRPPAP